MGSRTGLVEATGVIEYRLFDSFGDGRCYLMDTPHTLNTGNRLAAATADSKVIRTPDQRVRVFVSSTLDELAAERAAAREAITQLRLTPVFFESGARPYPKKTGVRRSCVIASRAAA